MNEKPTMNAAVRLTLLNRYPDILHVHDIVSDGEDDGGVEGRRRGEEKERGRRSGGKGEGTQG